MKKGLLVLAVMLISGSIAATGVLAQPEAYDLGGETIKITTAWPGITPWGPRHDYSWDDPSPLVKGHIESVEEMFNCKIEIVYPGRDPIPHDPGYLATSVMAGDEPFDYFDTIVIDGRIPIYIREGLIQPLDDVINHDEFYNQYPRSMRLDRELTQIAGETYVFGSVHYTREAEVVHWNMPLFEEQGLPNLYDLYYNGEWTFSALEEIAQMATRDTTGDGDIDQYGLNLGRMKRSLPINNASLTRTDEDGRIVIALDEPEAQEYMEFIQGLFEDGVVGAPAAMHVDGEHSLARPTHFDLWDGEWGMVPLPKGPSADKHVAPTVGFPVGAIPIYVDNPREVIEVVRALFKLSEPYIEDIEAWEDEYWEHQALYLRDRESLETWQWTRANLVLTRNMYALKFTGDRPYDEMWNEIIDGALPSTMAAQYKPVMQSYIDDLYGQ